MPRFTLSASSFKRIMSFHRFNCYWIQLTAHIYLCLKWLSWYHIVWLTWLRYCCLSCLAWLNIWVIWETLKGIRRRIKWWNSCKICRVHVKVSPERKLEGIRLTNLITSKLLLSLFVHQNILTKFLKYI